MVETKTAKSKLSVDGAILGAETQAISTTAETLATIGFTIPADATEIVLYNADATIEMRGTVGTPTATFGHQIRPGDLDLIPHNQIGTYKIRSDSGTPDLIAIFMG